MRRIGLFAAVSCCAGLAIGRCAGSHAADLYTKSLYDLTLQDPKAKIIDARARRHFVLKEVYRRDCGCFSGLFLNDDAVPMRDDPESPGIVAASQSGVFLVGEFESRACPYHYFVLSFRHPTWPNPIRSAAFGDCSEPKSVAFDGKGGMVARFADATVTFKDGKLSRK
jgi:hypothetical protein